MNCKCHIECKFWWTIKFDAKIEIGIQNIDGDIHQLNLKLYFQFETIQQTKPKSYAYYIE